MHNVNLIAPDPDGTLLGSKKRLSRENMRAPEQTAQAGIEIVLATGCFYRGMPELIRDLSQTMAFGDDLHDVTMLRAAGMGAATGNASPEATLAVDWVADNCDHSGVAKAIRRLLWEEDA